MKARPILLVVDDERAVRQVTADLLRQAGYDILLAADGNEALEVYHAHREQIAGMVLDFTLPQLSGEQVLRQIRDGGGVVPVVVSSGYSADDVGDALADVAGITILAKPYSPRELIDAVGGQVLASPA